MSLQCFYKRTLQMNQRLSHSLYFSFTLSILNLFHNYVHVAKCDRFNDATILREIWNLHLIFVMCVCLSVYYFFSFCLTRSIVDFRHDTMDNRQYHARHYIIETKFPTVAKEHKRRTSVERAHSTFSVYLKMFPSELNGNLSRFSAQHTTRTLFVNYKVLLS